MFVVNSFSKSWAMTGWRMGWLIYPRGMVDTFEKLIQFNTSGGQAFLQAGGVVALNEGEAFVRSFVERCRGGAPSCWTGWRRWIACASCPTRRPST